MNYNKTLEEGLKEFDDNLSKIFYTRPNTGEEATKNKEIVKSFLTTFAEKIQQEERENCVQKLIQIEKEKWNDADHCSCVRYAIIMLAGGADSERGKEIIKELQESK